MNWKNWKKAASAFVFSAGVGLYTTFVAQKLWNWFVIGAFRVPSLSFWEMYGLFLVVGLFVERDQSQLAYFYQLREVLAVVGAPLLGVTSTELEERLLKRREEDMWSEAGAKIMMRIYGLTGTLVAGWIVYTLFVSS